MVACASDFLQSPDEDFPEMTTTRRFMVIYRPAFFEDGNKIARQAFWPSCFALDLTLLYSILRIVKTSIIVSIVPAKEIPVKF